MITLIVTVVANRLANQDDRFKYSPSWFDLFGLKLNVSTVHVAKVDQVTLDPTKEKVLLSSLTWFDLVGRPRGLPSVESLLLNDFSELEKADIKPGKSAILARLYKIELGVDQKVRSVSLHAEADLKALKSTSELTLRSASEMVHQNAINKGFNTDGTLIGEAVDEYVREGTNLIVEEASELTKARRKRQLNSPCDKADQMIALGLEPLTCIEEEYADILARTLGQMAQLGIDPERALRIKMAYNATRPHMHGGLAS